jgi:uncharacterized protein YjbI with pentapeptide repeats
MGKESVEVTEGFEPPKYVASLIAAVNDGAKAAQAGSFLFLLVGVYLLATAFSASDEDLLLGKTVTISQINASLPVSFSFAIAPLVFVFLHTYALVRYDMLAANVQQFLRELRDTVKLESDRERCRQLLANNEFVAVLTTRRGSAAFGRFFWRWLFRGIVAVFPVAVLLLVQINALRYQSELITNIQRATLIFDLAVLFWFFARNPLYGDGVERVPIWRQAVRWSVVIGLPCLMIFLNLCWLGTVQADAAARLVRYDPEDFYWVVTPPKPSLSQVVRDPLDLIICPQQKWGCRFLRVDHRPLVDKVRDEKALAVLRVGADLPTDSIEVKTALAAIEGVVLRNRSLRFAVLADSRLYAADLIGADLTGADLTHGADLRGVRLKDAHLTGADFTGANLSGAGLTGADMTGAKLTRANLSGADMSDHADMTGANLSDANLTRADMTGANLTRADMTGANLSDANLTRAKLTRANLSGANLSDADMTGADLTGANLTPGDEPLADMTGAKLSDANLNEAKLSDAKLSDAKLTRANLTDTELTGPDLIDAKLSGANLHDADLTGANLTGANLTRANLSGANLSGGDLTRANLTGTDLSNTELTRANLNDADLTRANLNDAKLTRANLSGANLTRANLSGARLIGDDPADAATVDQRQLNAACGENVQLPPRRSLPRRCRRNP